MIDFMLKWISYDSALQLVLIIQEPRIILTPVGKTKAWKSKSRQQKQECS